MPTPENALNAVRVKIKELEEKLKNETNPLEIERLKNEIESLQKTL